MPAAMRQLMGGNRAAVVFTDPPFNVRIQSVQGRGKIKHRDFLEGCGLREILARKIAHRSGDRVRKITVLEGILLRITDDALRGSIKSAAFLLNRFAALVSGELQVQDLSDEDREVLEAFARRLEARRAND